MTRRSLGLGLYLALSRLAGPLAPGLLARRMRRGKEDPERVGERLGKPSAPRPAGRLVWLHGASVGEAMTLLPLVEGFLERDPALTLLVTSGTVTAAERLASALPEGAIHQYLPVDTGSAVSGFLDHWRPDLAVLVESELWPRLIAETHARHCPMMLLNARLSARSASRWRWAGGMAAGLLGRFARIVTQDHETVGRLKALGVPEDRLRAGGNLKQLIPLPECAPEELARLRRALAGRPVWLAASTHAPEEEIAAEAHALASADLPGLLTIIAPRHPERADEIEAQLRARDLAVLRRSDGALPGPGTACLLADGMGEMGLWYRLAPVSFVGGSMSGSGGHNPFEPAGLGSVILHGPDTANFRPAYDALAAAEAAVLVKARRVLPRFLAMLLRPDGGLHPAGERLRAAAAEVRDAERPDLPALIDEALALMAEGRP